LNDGKGHFPRAGDSVISLRETGIVTSAVFADVNHDGWNDLIVAGEWMGVQVFLNNKGRFNRGDWSVYRSLANHLRNGYDGDGI